VSAAERAAAKEKLQALQAELEAMDRPCPIPSLKDSAVALGKPLPSPGNNAHF
jgi:hypothetical protein